MYVASAAVYAGLLLSASRGAWAAAAVGILVVAGGALRQAGRGKLVLRLRPAAAMVVLLGVVTAALGQRPLVRGERGGVYLADRACSVRHFLRPVSPGLPGAAAVVQDQSINHRYFIWHVTWQMICSRPVVGLGYGCYGRHFAAFRDASEGTARFATLNRVARSEATPYAHNELLHVWAETGLLGVAAMVVLVSVTLHGVWRRAWSGGPATPWLWGALGLLVALLVDSLVSFPLRLPLGCLVFWLALGAAAGLAQR